MKRFLLALALLLGLQSTALAQFAGGNIYGTVTDESGAVLPGATVTLTGASIGRPHHDRGTQGDFRFLNLDPGTLQARRRPDRLRHRQPRRRSSTPARTSNLTFGLKVATVEETVTVTAETPVVDTKKLGTATTLTQGRAGQDPERPRPLGRPAHRPGRARGPRQHRRQRERPAVRLRGQGRGPTRHDVDPRRRGHHRHGGLGASPDLLRLRRLRRDQRHDRRQRPQGRRPAASASTS